MNDGYKIMITESVSMRSRHNVDPLGSWGIFPKHRARIYTHSDRWNARFFITDINTHSDRNMLY